MVNRPSVLILLARQKAFCRLDVIAMNLGRFRATSMVPVIALLLVAQCFATISFKVPASENGRVISGFLQTGRVVRITNSSGAPGGSVSTNVQLDSQGNENALSFSLV